MSKSTAKEELAMSYYDHGTAIVLQLDRWSGAFEPDGQHLIKLRGKQIRRKANNPAADAAKTCALVISVAMGLFAGLEYMV